MLRSMKKELKGFTIGATDGDIGTVKECYFDDASFTIRHLVVDAGGWLTERKVLISPRALLDVDWVGMRIHAALTKAQVEQSAGRHIPEVTRCPVALIHRNAVSEKNKLQGYRSNRIW